jgi:hypothetical protein
MFGFFEVEPSMVCFNKEGFVKVWCNRNLSTHHPENIFTDLKSKTFEHFIQQIIAMVEHLIDFEGEQTLSDFIRECRMRNPYDKMTTVLELYARERRVVVPRYLSSLRSICQKNKKKTRKNSENLDVPRYKLQSKNSFNSRSSKRLELQPQVVEFNSSEPLRLQTDRGPSDELRFRKGGSYADYGRNASFTQRSPPVRFQYQTLPNSPTSREAPEYKLARRSFAALSASNRNEAALCFLKKKKRSMTIDIDPEILADLDRITP